MPPAKTEIIYEERESFLTRLAWNIRYALRPLNPLFGRYRFHPWPIWSWFTLPFRYVAGHVFWWSLPAYYQEIFKRYKIAYTGGWDWRYPINEGSIARQWPYCKREWERYQQQKQKSLGIYLPFCSSFMEIASSSFEPLTKGDIKSYDDPNALWSWKLSTRYDGSGETSHGLCTRAQMLAFGNYRNYVEDLVWTMDGDD